MKNLDELLQDEILVSKFDSLSADEQRKFGLYGLYLACCIADKFGSAI